MLSTHVFKDRVVIQNRTKTKTATGIVESWADLVTLWASVLEIQGQTYVDMTDLDQNMSAMKVIKVTLRGRRDYAVAETRILFNGEIYKIIQAPRFVSRSDVQFTTIYCHRIDKLISSSVDSTAPTITSIVPAANALGVAITSNITITFSEAIVLVNGNYNLIKLSTGALVPFVATYDNATKTTTLNPSSSLDAATQYALTVSGVRDLSGNTLAASTIRLFITA